MSYAELNLLIAQGDKFLHCVFNIMSALLMSVPIVHAIEVAER
jgi:hypothetical protein